MRSSVRRMGGALGGLVALASGLTLACGSEETATPGAPMAAPAETAGGTETSGGAPVLEKVVLTPSNPQPGANLEARVTPSAPSRPGLRYEYEWLVDGRRQEANGPNLHVEGSLGRGTGIEVSVVAVVGDERSEPVRASARIGNSPPVLHGVMLEPQDRVTAGQSLTAHPKASDPDGDELSFDYRWDVNHVTVVTGEPILPAFHFKRGDSIRLTVSARDGSSSSNEIQSAAIVVGNSDPHIVSTPGALDALGRFTYRPDIEDADGDKGFSYRLIQGPRGMSMDPVDGTVRWEPRPEQTGKHPVKIEVTDREGGVGSQSFVMSIGVEGEGSDSSPANAAP